MEVLSIVSVSYTHLDVYKRQVYRGTKENAAKFITEQEHALQELYPPETEAAEAETGQPEEQIEGSAE